jgi:hypothetical protein
MKAIIVEDVVRVTSEPNAEAISIFTIKKGEVVETGKVTRKKKESWVEVTLPGGQKGFISGATRIFVMRQIELTAETNLLDKATEDATVIKTCPKGTIFTAVGVEKSDSATWYHVTESEGGDGYINSRSKYRIYQEATVGGGTRLMITGGIFIVLGVAFLVSSLSQGSNSSSMFLTVGLIALGGVQFVQGFLQWRRAKKKPQ